MPNVTGAAAKYWPGFWMLGAPYRGNWWNWPGVGELDIPDIAPRSSDLFLAGGSQANHLQSTIEQPGPPTHRPCRSWATRTR